MARFFCVNHIKSQCFLSLLPDLIFLILLGWMISLERIVNVVDFLKVRDSEVIKGGAEFFSTVKIQGIW